MKTKQWFAFCAWLVILAGLVALPVLGVANTTGFGGGSLHHVARYDPENKAMKDLGVPAVKNPEFYGLPLDQGGAIDPATGKARPWTHGFHRLPDGTLTPLHHRLAAQVAGDGTLYVTILYPFTLLRVEPQALGSAPSPAPRSVSGRPSGE